MVIRRGKGAFTLIELVMVIVVIGVLASIIIPKFVSQVTQAQIASTKANLQALRSAVELYYANEPSPTSGLASYPATLDTLTAAGRKTGTIYMRKIPTPSVKNVEDGVGASSFTYDATTGSVTVNIVGTDANGDTIADY
jgi:type II secretion system protein G